MIFLGVAAVSGSFNENVCKSMASNNKHPVILALSNPTSKSECTAEQAYTWTDVSLAILSYAHLCYLYKIALPLEVKERSSVVF